MKDFFISYTSSDEKYAKWIAELLEKNGYTTIIQAWDFRPGDNFVSKINKALTSCKKMIIVLSENYMKSNWCQAEWTSKIADQIKNGTSTIIPIIIRPVRLNGSLLEPISHINIIDVPQAQAETKILNGILNEVPRKADGYPHPYNIEHNIIDIDYYVHKNEIVYIKTCTSTVLADGYNCIHNRITWFPDETVTVAPLTPGTEIEWLNLRDTNRNFNVRFDHNLEKGKIVTFKFKAVLSNHHQHFENFFSTQVITPLRSLRVHLTLDDASVTQVFTQKIANSPMNIRTEQPKVSPYSAPYHWNIENPELNFEYKIYW